ncbi:unnamed protein product [Staurois parvus]|uniref:Uncharacterized protein n=1 Tax=Staurois parvus TaxID=386267 RepID=A0ABN9GHQ9_9NEOB|nr:unnamed protein product [Staurois parvus]
MGPYIPPPHAAARSTVSHGSLYGLPLLLSPSPHSAMCHFQVSSHCWCVEFFDIGCWQITGLPIAAARPLYTASSCCCQVQSLSWVPVRPPIAAVSIATLCHVPLSGLLTLLVC